MANKFTEHEPKAQMIFSSFSRVVVQILLKMFSIPEKLLILLIQNVQFNYEQVLRKMSHFSCLLLCNSPE